MTRLASTGKSGAHWQADTDIIVDDYLCTPSAAELASVRRVVARSCGQAGNSDEAMSCIRQEWQYRIAEALGEMVTSEADAAYVIRSILRVAGERHPPGFDARTFKQLGQKVPGPELDGAGDTQA